MLKTIHGPRAYGNGPYKRKRKKTCSSLRTPVVDCHPQTVAHPHVTFISGAEKFLKIFRRRVAFFYASHYATHGVSRVSGRVLTIPAASKNNTTVDSGIRQATWVVFVEFCPTCEGVLRRKSELKRGFTRRRLVQADHESSASWPWFKVND